MTVTVYESQHKDALYLRDQEIMRQSQHMHSKDELLRWKDEEIRKKEEQLERKHRQLEMQLLEINARSTAVEKREARMKTLEQDLKEKEHQMDLKFAGKEGELRAMADRNKSDGKETVYSEEMLKRILENQELLAQRMPVQNLNAKRSRSPKANNK